MGYGAGYTHTLFFMLHSIFTTTGVPCAEESCCSWCSLPKPSWHQAKNNSKIRRGHTGITAFTKCYKMSYYSSVVVKHTWGVNVDIVAGGHKKWMDGKPFHRTFSYRAGLLSDMLVSVHKSMTSLHQQVGILPLSWYECLMLKIIPVLSLTKLHRISYQVVLLSKDLALLCVNCCSIKCEV